MNVSFSITDLQKKTIPIKPVNVFKKPAPLVGVPTFAVDVKGVISIFPADDGSFVEVDAIDVGVSIITVTGQSVSGKTISIAITVTITVDPRATEATDFLADLSQPAVDEVVVG
jgi:hypothetical protein